jgi:endonuclease-3
MALDPDPIKRTTHILTRLVDFFGIPTWRIALPPVDELVSTILSQNTNDRNRDIAFDALKLKFPTWEEVLNAPAEDVIKAIQPAGLANQKGPRIQKVLQEIIAQRGNLDLGYLADLPREEVRKWFLRFNGVGPKTAAIVMQFSLGMPAFPVDTHIYRVTGRIGLRPAKLSVEETHILMEEIIPTDQYYAAHLNLIRLGREICTARKALCSVCPVCDFCNFGQNMKCVSD